jgi:hypothetical protein
VLDSFEFDRRSFSFAGSEVAFWLRRVNALGRMPVQLQVYHMVLLYPETTHI